MFRYSIYGLSLQVNRSIPGLTPASFEHPADVKIDLMQEDIPQKPSADVENISSGLRLETRGDRTYFHLWFCGDGRLDFEIDDTGRYISATWTRSVIEEVTALLLGQVLGLALRLRGTLCFHACVVKVGKGAVAIVGESGAGKSTTAAAMSKRGHIILSDDVAALKQQNEPDQNGPWMVQPGYPRLRLWPNSVRKLYGSEHELERIFSFSDKRFIDLSSRQHVDNPQDSEVIGHFQSTPLPLTAIYILGKRQPGNAPPIIEPVTLPNAVMTLMAHRSVGHVTLDFERQSQTFAALSEMVKTVLVRRVIRSDSLSHLSHLCRAIEADTAELTASDVCLQH